MKFNWKKIATWSIALLPALALGIVAIMVSLPGTTETVAGIAQSTPGILGLDDPANGDAGLTAKGFAIIGGGLAGLGMFGAGIGQGYAAGKAAEAVSRNPEAEAKIRSMFLVGAAIAESSALYGFVIAIMAVFIV